MNHPSTPGSGDKLDLASVNGNLLYITVKAVSYTHLTLPTICSV